MADQDYNNEVFIDADAGFASEKNSYEVIILRQISKCVEILSREMTGGQVIEKSGPGGVSKYVEDTRELVINHVDALRMLMCTYIKDHNKKQIDKLLKEVFDYKSNLGETEIMIPGKGPIKLKNIKGMQVEHPVWKEYIHFKAHKFREMFEVLVNAYNEQKAYIRSLEEE